MSKSNTEKIGKKPGKKLRRVAQEIIDSKSGLGVVPINPPKIHSQPAPTK